MSRLHGFGRRVGALVATSAALALALPAAGYATQSELGTASGWNGKENVGLFGDPETATYGQTITAPSRPAQLVSFTFHPDLPTGLMFRAYVFKWDAETGRAIGSALYEGPDMHTSSYVLGAYTAMTVTTGGVPLTPGDQYVLFFSVSGDKAADEGTGLAGSLGYVEPAETAGFTGGGFVQQNSKYEPAAWTAQAWVVNNEEDLAFSAVLGERPEVSSVTPSTAPPGGEVTISGHAFTGTTEVLFGETPATGFTVNNDASITAIAPKGAGSADVRVITPEGESEATPTDRITYSAPATETTIPKQEAAATPVPSSSVPVTSIQKAPAIPTPVLCESRRSAEIHWKTPMGVHLTRTAITLNGRPYRVMPGTTRRSEISFAGRGSEPVTVELTGTGRGGGAYVNTRIYHPCATTGRHADAKTVYLLRR